MLFEMRSIKYYFAILLIVMWGISSIFITTSFMCGTEKIINANNRIGNNRVTKTILLWNSFYNWPDYRFGFGREPFFQHKCEYTDCYLTNDKNMTSLDNFDAVVFHGPQFYPHRERDYPARRSARQLYVYFSMESPDIFPPVPAHDGRFNLTVTYRLDADVHFPYTIFADMKGNKVSPAWNPLWERPTQDRQVLKEFEEIHRRKTKPVAWFVSRCSSPNKRLEFVKKLQNYIDVDIYGQCGPLKCPNSTRCFEYLKRDYYFYLSFENSNCVDYVTEKLYNAFSNDAIPIVFNGADMKRFAPPATYINAGELDPPALADRIKFLINNSAEYSKFFWWKNHYQVKFANDTPPFCSLCKILHDEQLKVKTYPRFGDWLSGSGGNRLCKHY